MKLGQFSHDFFPFCSRAVTHFFLCAIKFESCFIIDVIIGCELFFVWKLFKKFSVSSLQSSRVRRDRISCIIKSESTSVQISSRVRWNVGEQAKREKISRWTWWIKQDDFLIGIPTAETPQNRYLTSHFSTLVRENRKTHRHKVFHAHTQAAEHWKNTTSSAWKALLALSH